MHELKARTNLFAGNSNLPLATSIADLLGTKLSNRELTTFSDGEIRCEILEHVRGNQAFIIQSTCRPVNDHLMEILVMCDALKARQGVAKIVLVIPYFGYSRQDRKPGFNRTPITSKLVFNMLATAGVDHMVVVDIHSEQQLGFANFPVTNLGAAPELIGDIWRNHFHEGNVVIVSPDTGGVVRARAVAKQVDNADLAIIDKRRPEANVAEVMNVIGDVRGRRCIVVDDMIDTAGTLCKAAVALKERGATYIAAYATHAVFSGKAYDNIANSEIDEIVVTDTIPLNEDMARLEKVRQISVANLIAETMFRLRAKKSISEIYTGS